MQTEGCSDYTLMLFIKKGCQIMATFLFIHPRISETRNRCKDNVLYESL